MAYKQKLISKNIKYEEYVLNKLNEDNKNINIDYLNKIT